MTFSIENIAQSIANHLADKLPEATFYEDPNQQKTALPCAFVQQTYSTITNRVGRRFLRHIGLDLTYLVDYNLPNMQQLYVAAAEVLDENMELIPYSDGTNTAQLHTYDRETRIDLDALHYKFELRVWVEPEEHSVPMQSMDYNERIKDYGES